MSAALTRDDAESVVERMQADPVFTVREILGAAPWQTQSRIIESVWANRHTGVPSCHASGKTWVAARIALAFLYSYPGSRVIVTAPTDRQVRNVFWPELSAAHANAKVKLGGDLTTEKLTLAPDWFALAFAASSYQQDRFQGFHANDVLVVVDEASGVPKAISDQIAAILSGGHARQLLIGNPLNPLSSFRDACESEDVTVIPIDALDTPNFSTFGIEEIDFASGEWAAKVSGKAMPYPQLITPEWAAEMYRRWGPKSPSWLARVRGRFPDVVEHAVYGSELRDAEAAKRITLVPHQKETGVITAWDLGTGDAMAIWFVQQVGQEVHWIDYVQDTGKGFPYYAQLLQQRAAERGYVYRRHLAPHDIAVQELGTGKTRLEMARSLGIHFETVPKVEVEDGIESLRALLGRSWFDRESTKEGLAALRSYRYDMDPKLGVLSRRPVHDWASDGADAARCLAVGLRPNRLKVALRRPDTRWMA